jgi:hypothetical protein
MPDIPLVMIHRGNQPWFRKFVEINAKRHGNLVLIGDDQGTQANYFYQLDDYAKSFEEIMSLYVHLNTTPLEYSSFNYCRWFILREYMQRNNIDVSMYLDSDVVMLADPDIEWKSKWNRCSFTLMHGCCAASSFFTSYGINDFCEYMLSIYRNKDGYDYKKIASHFNIRQSSGLPGGVCDMQLFWHYFYNHCYEVGEMMRIAFDYSTYDHSISSPDGYEMAGEHKALRFRGGMVYGIFTRLGTEVCFNSLHLQGDNKQWVFELEGYLAR